MKASEKTEWKLPQTQWPFPLAVEIENKKMVTEVIPLWCAEFEFEITFSKAPVLIVNIPFKWKRIWQTSISCTIDSICEQSKYGIW